MLTPFSLIVSLATVSVTTGTYVISFPNSLIPGIPLQIRVLVQNCNGPVSVWAGLKYVQNDSLVAENTTSVQSGISTTLSINVPGNLLPSEYKVDTLGSGGLVFENSSNIRFEDRGLIVLIQTDKTRYSAGQTVKYRAVLLLPNLLNFQGQATVTIQDGNNNRIEVNGPNSVTSGVISGQLELSRYPVFGSWKLVIDAMGKTTSKTFEVNDYVLPRFTVQITLPTEIHSTQTTFTVDVEATFTFNTDVIGNCTVLFYNEDEPSNNFSLNAELKGSVQFTVQMSQINNKLDLDSRINIRATVADNATALTMVAERSLNIVFDIQHSVTISKVDQYRNSFIPGMTYRTKLLVQRGNQPVGQSGYLTVTPTVTTAVLETCTLGNPAYTWLNVQDVTGESMSIPFNELGYADLSYHVDDNAEMLSLKVQLNDPSIQPFSTYKRIYLYPLSTSMPLMRIYANKVQTVVDESVSLDITATENLNGNLTFEVYSRGMLLTSEHVAINGVSNKTHNIYVTKDMIPRAYILVHHLTHSGYLIADYVFIQVEGNPVSNEVRVSYGQYLLQPRQIVDIRISADPRSTVYVLVEDERNRIIGTHNDIFYSDVISGISGTSYNVSENILKSTNNKRKKRDAMVNKLSLAKRSHGSLWYLHDVHIETGLLILSDANILEKKKDLLLDEGYQRQCVPPTTRDPRDWKSRLDEIPRDPDSLMYTQSAAGEDNTIYEPMITLDLPGPNLGEIVRSLFPETWIWDEYNIGASGEISIKKTVPDSLTTWVTSVFAVNPTTGFGICNDKPELTVKKNFFLTMDLPTSIILGEEFLLQITAFNYLPYRQQVFLQVTLSEDPNNPIPAATIVQAGEGHSTYVFVTPKSLGDLNITVMARTGFFSTSISDMLVKTVLVRPNGVLKSVNEQHLIDANPDNEPITKTFELGNPVDMVEGTKILEMKITGNLMVPSLEGLHNLIRMPYGCGEQAMLNFAPAIYITKYLKTVGKLTPKIQKKSTESLKTGLQRELRYQHYDGSFSAFGKTDPSGSSWLTAFVLKCFGQADGLIQIDEAIMSKAMNWLLTCQQSDGSFSEPGRVIQTSMQAGTASGIKMTAFILISLLENKNISSVRGYKLDNAITKGKTYLEARMHTAYDAYTLAIVCYALASAGSSYGSTCFDKLKMAATIDDDKKYWTASTTVAKREIGDRSLAKRAPSADIEASSYALLAYMKLGRTSEAFPIVKWLVSQRNPTGGYRSTQDTIISLQALSEFSSSGSGSIGPPPDYGVQFSILSGQDAIDSYSATPSTFDVVHSIKIPNALDSVNIQITGTGSAVIDVTTSFYVTGSELDDYIAVVVTITNETINTATIKACLSWTGPEASGMLIMEVEMPTGFQPDNDFLKAQDLIKRHETNGRNIALYFDGVDENGEVCVDVKMDRKDPVVKSQACHVSAYDYYEPAHQAMTRYEFGMLKEANICLVCPLCEFCMGNGSGGQAGVGR
ncbi:CD109 antigen-like [Mercenaria mercenaria]|uniref:CD109 antigen-like n=1 Tax=Mercenaria mercenaria TaxID=6596 RepID=UPI00234E7C5D|nr:CD109 antigen-like [Mercenaria mercenaria]